MYRSVVPKVWVKTQIGSRRVKNGSRRGDPNRDCVFSKLPLLVCV